METLHHDEGLAARRRVDVEHLDAVPALQRGGRACLAREALDDLRIAEKFGVDHLDRDELVELHVAGEDDAAHPAGAELALDRVLAGDERGRLAACLEDDELAAGGARHDVRANAIALGFLERPRQIEEQLLLGRTGLHLSPCVRSGAAR